jgi:hypothetical protein
MIYMATLLLLCRSMDHGTPHEGFLLTSIPLLLISVGVGAGLVRAGIKLLKELRAG